MLGGVAEVVSSNPSWAIKYFSAFSGIVDLLYLSLSLSLYIYIYIYTHTHNRSGGGVVDNTLDYQSRGRKIDPPLLRSFG